ncbi:MAG: class I SAM-dependent DNA methyltransferase [Lachnospiraceae bacterium]|nr:class I SAM-dependent DNA methyltransferase [Lachnospiraceae bacterium]
MDCKKGSVEGQIILDVTNPIKVSINQFYGIEINDFAVTVAKTALWIAESQMIKKTEDIVHRNIDFLPLKTNANIVEANALRISWESVVSKNYLNFIMGNPPFVGKKEQSKSQKDDMTSIFGKKNRGIGNLDYVSAWYKKTADFINGSNIKCALVSTNSITQGEQVPILWNGIANQIQIIFAYRTFRWDSEASQKAHVHCVIIGFCDACIKQDNKIIFDGESKYSVQNINPYLVDAPNILIDNHNRPISGVPEISYGSMPIDDGNLILNKEDVENLLSENADNSKFIRKYVGGDELLNNKDRWCLWLWGASPREIQASKIILDRINKTCQFRKSSNRPQTVALAETPMLFGEIRQPDTTMLVIPKVSSEKRRYIPISYVSPEIIVNGSSLIIPNAELYHFGVLISNVHMAWMRAVCGRMKSDYQYSGKIVYNNFPWCVPSAIQREKIEKTAQAILDARSLYPKSSLADLYDPLTMPVELLKAHKENDRAVMEAYGFDVKTMSEEDCVAELMKMYQELTKTEG